MTKNKIEIVKYLMKLQWRYIVIFYLIRKDFRDIEAGKKFETNKVRS